VAFLVFHKVSQNFINFYDKKSRLLDFFHQLLYINIIQRDCYVGIFFVLKPGVDFTNLLWAAALVKFSFTIKMFEQIFVISIAAEKWM